VTRNGRSRQEAGISNRPTTQYSRSPRPAVPRRP
jgi:hypothetical protein